MIKKQMLIFFLQYVPEELTLSFVILVLLNIKLDLKRLLLLGLSFTLITYCSNKLPITKGLKYLLAFLLISIIISNIYNQKITNSFITIFKATLILASFEIYTVTFYNNILNFSINRIANDIFIRTSIILFNSTLLLLTGIIIYILNYRKDDLLNVQ